jgi:hypothetical protein
MGLHLGHILAHFLALPNRLQGSREALPQRLKLLTDLIQRLAKGGLITENAAK